MNLFLCHDTAERLWRSYHCEQLIDRPARVRMNEKCASLVSDIEELSLPSCVSDFSTGKPLHVLASAPSRRSDNPAFCFHCRCIELPHASFHMLCRNVYVVSPELLLLEMSKSMGFADTVLLGCELAGTYRLCQHSDESDGVETLFNMPSLTSQRKLANYLAACGNVRGAKRARVAAKYVVDGSSSPMESALALLLSLPHKYGGYGLPRPALNVEIPLTADSQTMVGKRCCRGDIVYPASKLDIEYDSDFWHVGAERIAEDSARRNALLAEGYDVITITKAQVYDRQQLDLLAQLIARKLKFRIRVRCDGYGQRQRALREVLLP